jgi:regulator of replication initiation timing
MLKLKTLLGLLVDMESIMTEYKYGNECFVYEEDLSKHVPLFSVLYARGDSLSKEDIENLLGLLSKDITRLEKRAIHTLLKSCKRGAFRAKDFGDRGGMNNLFLLIGQCTFLIHWLEMAEQLYAEKAEGASSADDHDAVSLVRENEKLQMEVEDLRNQLKDFKNYSNDGMTPLEDFVKLQSKVNDLVTQFVNFNKEVCEKCAK